MLQLWSILKSTYDIAVNLIFVMYINNFETYFKIFRRKFLRDFSVKLNDGY